MDRLGRYPLSVILSFLSETEGTSLLITKRRYAQQLLPIFRLRDGLSVSNAKNRHRFVVAKVQDSKTLLERLNSKRLYMRKKSKQHGLTTSEMALREWKQQQQAPSSSSPKFPPHLELLRFLNKDSEFKARGITLLASYPRSGNSLVRSLLEKTTGVVTGSDTRPDRSLSRELAEKHNMVGEGVSQNVAYVKTHWPERKGNAVFEGKRCILVVRNPFDAIDSYWNMNATRSHTKSLAPQVYEQFRDKFDALVRNEIEVWLKFHKFWLETNVPLLIVRFEDLIQNTERELRRMLCFTLGITKLSSFWEKRVDHVSGRSIDRLGSYTPRCPAASTFGKSIHKGHYSKDQLTYMRNLSESFSSPNILEMFGYGGDFPESGLSPMDPNVVGALETRKETIDVNTGTAVRAAECSFGRALTNWRHSVTDHDRNPLPTLS